MLRPPLRASSKVSVSERRKIPLPERIGRVRRPVGFWLVGRMLRTVLRPSGVIFVPSPVLQCTMSALIGVSSLGKLRPT